MADVNMQARDAQFVKMHQLFNHPVTTADKATAERTKTLSRVIVTISDYSDKGCLTKIAHTIVQVFRQIISILLTIFTFGTFRWGTEWQVTRREVTKLVKADLKEQIAEGIKQLDPGSAFSQKIEKEVNEKKFPDDAQKDAYRTKRRNELAEAAVKRIDVSGYTNDLMLDILDINKAKNKIDTGIRTPDERALVKLIMLREAATIAQTLADKTAEKGAKKEERDAAAKKLENFYTAKTAPFAEISLVVAHEELVKDYNDKIHKAGVEEAALRAREHTANEAQNAYNTAAADLAADALNPALIADETAKKAALDAAIAAYNAGLKQTDIDALKAAADAAKAVKEAADKIVDAAKKPTK